MSSAEMTDEKLSDAAGCSRSMITKLRLGVAAPSLDLIHRIREATNGAVTADDFLPPRIPAEPAPVAAE